ncbi:hypothetical protein M595_5095 [Lyngbya aestuarii BL J]|uniref:Lipoprotein n=1 Tax=Lyngbya aestuarii BL J TaxID=1348334 RepID=U7QET9_9CYAN|nr:hypothetical protein [Lyngbya aestuarii]ERT04951.1 hypothetical protein M595_5095 [Lyngbya aestuarii BL J]
MITKISKANSSSVRKFSALLILGVIGMGTMACESSSLVFKQNPTKTAIFDQNSEPNLPTTRENGDFIRSSQKTWEAVNANSNGLNCHGLNLSYEELIDPRNSVKLDIENWPVVGQLKQGQDFEINLGPAGLGMVYDAQQNPWMYVENTRGENGPSNCFVRANRRFVKPISVKAFNQG